MVLLRVGGCAMLLATLAIVLPTRWMASIHQWLGLGTFPAFPIVEYLTRSISALYAIHGGLLLLVSSDIPRFAPIVRYLGVTTSLLGISLLAIDVFAGLPVYWVLFEGPPVILIGGLILGLLEASGHK